jgi:SAM-dependent methyltransferase
MNSIQRAIAYVERFLPRSYRSVVPSEPQIIANGWNRYAKEWQPTKLQVLLGHRIEYLGDEWTAEDVSNGGTTYGLAPDVVANFDDYINRYLLYPYLPSHATEGLEIGPGGGRITALLVPRTKVLHLADASEAMLQHLKDRFTGASSLRYYHTDGITLPALPPQSLDYVVAFDVFVHFEPRLIYWYLRQIAYLLKPGGMSIIHYANALTTIGWKQFESDLVSNLQYHAHFAAFGVMCPQLMARFLDSLNFETISADIGLIPRDAIAVFRNPVTDKTGQKQLELNLM